MRKKLFQSQKGQVAFFVILIFQVLFVFFAMIVNVGLLVHHKINLQNSVDLAAYYGAMKQADTMNAIAHINYQIRQSYKLLNFHHSQLGTAGVDAPNPWDWKNKKFRFEDDAVVNYDPVFCVGYTPFGTMSSTESYCMDPKGLHLPGIGIPSLATGIGAVFVSLQGSIKDAAIAARTAAYKGCVGISTTNWFALARFIYAYKLDVRNRKQLLLSLANEISKSNPNDLDGKSVREGVYKTLIKNLTYQNAAEIQSRYGKDGVGTASDTASFEIVNGLSVGGCGVTGGENEPPGWLSEINIYPLMAYLDATNCPDNESAPSLEPKFINEGLKDSGPKYADSAKPPMTDLVKSLGQVIAEPSGEDPATRLFKSTLGFEKNPWCMGYFGVRAVATPKIPFSPLGDVKLTARAFAKPFGGRIGPWYSETWPAGQTKSSGTKTDRVAPLRVDFGAITINENDPETKTALRLNYSRFMGDESGARSRKTTGEFSKAIHAMNTISLDWWRHLLENPIGDKDQNGDLLAWDNVNNQTVFMRDLEIAAIAPDNFDTSYYSIDPDFYNNYLVRIKKGYENKFQFDIRGDLGSRALSDDETLKRFSIRSQIENVTTKTPVDVVNKLTYVLNEFSQVLTSWQGISPYNYNLDKERFGKCLNSEIKPDAPEGDMTPGSCVSGGRVGYSVKLVDGSFIKNSTSIELGGAGIKGSVKNLPPNNF